MVWFASDKRWNESVHIPDVVVDVVVVDVVDVEYVAVNFIVIPIYLGFFRSARTSWNTFVRPFVRSPARKI